MRFRLLSAQLLVGWDFFAVEVPVVYFFWDKHGTDVHVGSDIRPHPLAIFSAALL